MTDNSSICVLLVEDECLIAMDVEDFLSGAGYKVHHCTTVGAALNDLASYAFDIAVLDVNVDGEQVFPVAEPLHRQRVPFVFVSGHTSELLPEHFRRRPFVTKPYDPDALLNALAKALSPRSSSSGEAEAARL